MPATWVRSGHSSNGLYDEADGLVARASRSPGRRSRRRTSPRQRSRGGSCAEPKTKLWMAFTASERMARPPAIAGCMRSRSPRRAGYSSPGASWRPDARDSRRWWASGTGPETGHSSGIRCRAVSSHWIGSAKPSSQSSCSVRSKSTPMLGVAPMSSILHDLVFAIRNQLVDSAGTERAGELLVAGAACPVDDIVLRTRRVSSAHTEPGLNMPSTSVSTPSQRLPNVHSGQMTDRCWQSSAASVAQPRKQVRPAPSQEGETQQVEARHAATPPS